MSFSELTDEQWEYMEKTRTLVGELYVVSNNLEHSESSLRMGSINLDSVSIDSSLLRPKRGELCAYNGHKNSKRVKVHLSVDDGIGLS